MLNRILNVKYNLHKWNIANDPYCELCENNNLDTIMHALVECPWTCDKIEQILNTMGREKSNFGKLNWRLFLFGSPDPSVNCILLIIKDYLISTRTTNTQFNIRILTRKIYWEILSDKKLLKSTAFDNKWRNFENLVKESCQYARVNGYFL